MDTCRNMVTEDWFTSPRVWAASLTREQLREVEEEEGVLRIEEYTNEKWRAVEKTLTMGYVMSLILTNMRREDGS